MIHSFTVCASGPPCGETRAAWRDRFFGGTNNQAGIRRPSNVRYLTSFPSANSPVGNLPRRLSTRTRPLCPEVATDRALRIREVDHFLHVAGEIHEPYVVVEPDPGGEGDALSIRPPCDLCHDFVHVRELLRLASRRLDDEDIVSVAIPV